MWNWWDTTEGPNERAGFTEPPVKYTPKKGCQFRVLGNGEGVGLPVSSAIKSERPIPMGAIKVPLCFSAASMKMVKTSSAERNISMKRPCTTEVPPPRFVRTVRGPGNSAEHIAAAVIPPSICAMTRNIPLK